MTQAQLPAPHRFPSQWLPPFLGIGRGVFIEGETMSTTTERDWVEEVGKPAFAAIEEMVAAVTLDWERFEELKEISEDPETKYSEWEDREEFEELREAAGDCSDEDDARERIEQDPLSVELGGWWSPGSEPEATEYRILLSTGGPAVRIVGDLTGYYEPATARLEVQGWFKPWTEHPCDDDVLLEYASRVYLGG